MDVVFLFDGVWKLLLLHVYTLGVHLLAKSEVDIP